MAGHNTTQFDRKLSEILRRAAAVFCERGYHQASIRDIARATGMSLAGLYYYVSSKEQLLYLIQRHAFETILEAGRRTTQPLTSAEARLRTLVALHLRFFIEHPNEMKVLTHEARSLEEDWRRQIHALKKAYYRLCFDQVAALKRQRKLRHLNTRTAVLALFGMMNWIYTWYDPRRDPDAETLSTEMSTIFFGGIFGRESSAKAARRGLGARNGSKRNGRKAHEDARLDGLWFNAPAGARARGVAN